MFSFHFHINIISEVVPSKSITQIPDTSSLLGCCACINYLSKHSHKPTQNCVLIISWASLSLRRRYQPSHVEILWHVVWNITLYPSYTITKCLLIAFVSFFLNVEITERKSCTWSTLALTVLQYLEFLEKNISVNKCSMIRTCMTFMSILLFCI